MPHRQSTSIISPSLLLLFICIIINYGSIKVAAMNAIAINAAVNKSRCYSCASDNMKENFITRERGPPGRIAEPKIYDGMCDSDTWIIKEKSAVECDGACFKWQQVLNNSGVQSLATIRGCVSQMFGRSINMRASHLAAAAEPFHSDCSTTERVLACIDQSTLIEHTCYCQGDYCNSAQMGHYGWVWVWVLLLAVIIILVQ